MKKEIYCRYCGLELELGECTCKEFLNSRKQKRVSKKIIKCDTCGKEIPGDAKYCPYCGISLKEDGHIVELHKELQGEFAEDVLEHYNGKKVPLIQKIKSNFSPRMWTLTVILSVLLLVSILGTVLYLLFGNLFKPKVIETTTTSETHYEAPTETSEVIEETTQQLIDPKERWIKQDGFYYCFDENGDPVVDDWVTVVDQDGNEQKYYFDIDGKLVVDSWIDGEYYVGPDGAMLRDTETPDGARVDENGKVIIYGENGKPIEDVPKVYYESYDANRATRSATTMKSSTDGVIKGVDPEKQYDLYIKSLVPIRDTVVKGEDKCNILIYYPVMDGTKEKEVRTINEKISEKANGELLTKIKDMLTGYGKLPKDAIFSEVEQRTISANRATIILHGIVKPRDGLTEKRKYRIIYDRKSKQLLVADISNGT